MNKIDFQHMVEQIDDIWMPVDACHINDSTVRVCKIEGAYNWHVHNVEDEFFMVLKGKAFIDFQDRTVELTEQQGLVVKHGTRHRSRTETGQPAWVMLVEPTRTKTLGENIQEK